MADRTTRKSPVQHAFDRLYRFHGGLVLPGHRELTATASIIPAGIPPVLVMPLLQHIGEPAEALVKPGDTVHTGQMIARPVGTVSAPVHASASGTVVAIEPRPVPHPSGLAAECIVIETDGRDTPATPVDATPDYRKLEPQALLERIREAGIVGLGGAGFPTRVKLAFGKRAIDALLINGAECEPYITCDRRLMQERAAEVIEGVRILQYIVQPGACTIAVEDSMPEAETALRDALEALQETTISVTRVPTIYPAGGERQLIKVLTGLEVPSQGLPADIGLICQNVGTAAAVYRAISLGQPLLSRIVTVTGEGVLSPRNLEVRIGTPLNHLVTACGGYTQDVDRLLIGGPMMGYAVSSDAVPVIKTTNCILAVTREEMPAPPPAQPCIRCGKCTEVCPADLLPQQLYWYARSGNHDAAQDYDLFDCIECGCCAYVCPSHIPLVQYYRHAKTAIWAQEKQRRKADLARQRHEARLARLERIKQERAEKLARKKQALKPADAGPDPRQAAIQAALERVKRKKEQAGVSPGNTTDLTPEQRRQIEAADQRRAAQKHTDRQAE
ncbi:MAG TPA: electron transport complex subunit RsxC [Gammaproteobacteria bacterium]|nr:electron transport complex subunit RsxC [Gammaproteobacteria bacterium]